ncbi:MAG: alpha/beta hydrolase [Leptolyngbyaceae bacterium]|nr:alpha/beta hydrolase [Leptolyngbyaceae bacterium]
MSQIQTSQITLKNLLLGSSFVLGASIGTLALSPQAQAIERVRFTSNAIEVTISEEEVERFAESGELPDSLQTFFDQTPHVPDDIRSLLTSELRLPRAVEDFLESPTGEFALIQIDQTINSASTSGDLDALRTAFSIAGEDRSVSFLELVKAYPEDEVSVDLTGLEDVYTRTVTFVERIQPAIETAIGFLQDIVCDCETVEATEADTPEESGSSASRLSSGCQDAGTEAAATEPVSESSHEATSMAETAEGDRPSPEPAAVTPVDTSN